MSRKQSLAKKIAHTLMAMSIVYSSGINIVVNQVYAAETKNLTNSDSTFSKEGVWGNNYNDVGGVTDGESVVFTGIVTENITNNIVVDVKGGKGGNDNDYSSGSPTVSVGAKGGSGIAQITIDESLSDIKLGNISISAYGATQGQSIYAISNVGGAAEAYGLQVKHDLKITAADITVEAKSNSSIISNIGDFKKPDTIAVGLQVEGSKVDFTGGGINLSVKTNSYYPGSQSNRQPGNYDGVDAKAYGIRSSISETTVKLNGNLTFMEVNGGDGDSYGYIDANSGVGAGCGGNATAYGIEVNGGKAHLDLKNIATDSDNSLRGGNGGSGSGNSSILTSVVGGSGGMVTASGVHIAGGKADGNIGNITMSGSGGIGGIGGGMDEGAAAIGGVGGAAVMAGIGAEAGQTELTVAKVNIKTTGGQGGTGGASIRGTSGVGGTGGTAYAHGVLGIAASSMQVKAADIIVSGIGGVGGTGGSNYNNGGVGGTGGAAEAYGISAINSVVNIDVANIQTTATGGKGGTGDQGGKYSYKGNGGDGGVGGNAYAYGVQSSGGTVTAATDKITATASGGMAGAAGSGNNGGVAGTVGAIGAEAKAYGIYAESGAVVNLSGKTPSGTITIGAKADNAQNTEAYAVYADKATVLFNDNAVLNTSDGSTDDNTVLTYLKDATLGFGGTDANRTVTGGTLKLEGSNTFRVTTDLKSDAADKFTFNSLAAGSSTENQYITVGYDKAFDGSDLTSINGDAVVLTFGELNGQNLNFEGKTSTLDSPLTRFTATPTVETSGNDVKITQIDFGKNPDGDASETAMVGSDAQMALGSMWRIEGNNLMKRMGELRSDKEAAKGGVWARYYRGELSADSAYDRNYSQDYTAFQGGIDKEQDYKGGKLYTGIAVNRIDSNAGYTAGSGDLSSTGVGVYASWLGSKGHYIDVIARGSKLTNDFKLVDPNNIAAKADYDTWAYGISTEYGYRQDLNAGWFVEPQAELSLGHIGSVDYTMSNGGRIENDGVDSAVTRVGILGGKEFTIGGRSSNAYVKASLLHDFGGNGGATGYYGSDSLALQTGDLTGTWYEIGLGANLGIAKNSNLYFDALKTFGGDLRTDWQFNAGLRFTF